VAKRLRRRCERVYRSSPTPISKQQFDKATSDYFALLNSKRVQHVSSKLESSNVKSRFKMFNELLGKPARVLPTVERDDLILANKFNKFFADKVDTICNGIPTGAAIEFPVLASSELSQFELVSSDEICLVAKGISSSSSPSDIMPTKVFKSFLPNFITILTLLYNLSLSSGVFPDSWKTGVVCPILKKHNLDSNELSSYRPITNVLFPSKILEKIVFGQLNRYLLAHDYLSKFQSAYRRFFSTETALLKVSTDILQLLDNRHNCITISLDLSAAFDTVNHGILLDILQKRLGVSGSVLHWIRCYLTGRSQSVFINGIFSSLLSVMRGVPQGSILGPLLFCCYLIPLADMLDQLGVFYHFYADDSFFYFIIDTNHSITMQHIHSIFHKVQLWFTGAQLKLNTDKTEIMLINPRSAMTVPAGLLKSLMGEAVTASKKVKSLGFVLDDSFTFESQVNSVCSACHFHLRRIYSVKNLLPPDALHTLCRTLVISRLDYCNSLYLELPAYLIQKLQRVQNSAARLIYALRRYDHITPFIRELHWLTVRSRIIFKVLCIIHKVIHHPLLVPEYILDLFQHNRRVTRLEYLLDLDVPTHMTSYGRRSLRVAGPRLWNALPSLLKHTPSHNDFRRKLKTHLFNA
jgi:hypothetical protein